MPKDVGGFDPAQDVLLDDDSLRVIAHPLRVQLLSELRHHGPATASQLGQRLGQSSGAASYHLRQLADHGFVVEDPERGDRRDRWWRAAHRTTRFEMSQHPGNQAAGGEYLRAVARHYSGRMLRFADEVEAVPETYGPEWAEIFTLSDVTLHLTAAQAARLHGELLELLVRYRDHPSAEALATGADSGDESQEEEVLTLVAQVQLFPLPPTKT